MQRYLLMRLASLVPVLAIVAVISFALVHLTPGDPASFILGPEATDADLARMRVTLGLDQPLPAQFLRWTSGAVRGDLGVSLFNKQPVTSMILERLEPTLILTALSLLVALAIGIPSGVLGAVHRNSALDQAILVVTLLGVSMPSFWLAINLILLFSVDLRLLPVAGYAPLSSGWLSALPYLVMPSVALGFSQAAIVCRITRTSMLEVLGHDYVRTARAKGLRERVVLYHHALRNAWVPIVTVIGTVIAVLLSGAIVIETVFNLPGIGRLIITAVSRRDYPVIQGVVLFITGLYVVFNLAIDLMYARLDPRIRLA